MNIRTLPFLFLMAATAAFAATAYAASPSKPCADCHKKISSGRVVHAAVGMGCDTCHVDPHAKRKPERNLVKPLPELCFSCHDSASFQKKVVHAPVASGGCTLCHNPHSSENPRLLSQPLPYLCDQCHKDKADGTHVLSGGYGLGKGHPTRGRKDPSWKGRELSCRSCHEPHSSPWQVLAPQTASGGLTCHNCHSRVTVRP